MKTFFNVHVDGTFYRGFRFSQLSALQGDIKKVRLPSPFCQIADAPGAPQFPMFTSRAQPPLPTAFNRSSLAPRPPARRPSLPCYLLCSLKGVMPGVRGRVQGAAQIPGQEPVLINDSGAP